VSMTNLVFLCHQRVIHPFINSEIHVARSRFSSIHYVTLKLDDDNLNVGKGENVRIEQVTTLLWYLALLRLPLMLLRTESLANIVAAIRAKKFGWRFVRHHVAHLMYAEVLKMRADQVIKECLVKSKKVYVLACWFSVEAYAAAQLKMKYPQILVGSLAHAFEVDHKRNDFIGQSFNRQKHSQLDRITFISRLVYENYYMRVMFGLRLADKNVSIRYLGCRKLYAALNHPSSDNIFRVWSCSSVVSVKRLALMAEALGAWTEGRIEWTHIGGGPLFDDLQTKSATLTSANSLVSVKLLGTKTNDQVHRYFVENQCDIFINLSSSEGLPVSLMECMAYGVPAVVTDVGGNSEIVNAETGFLLPQDFAPQGVCDLLASYRRLHISDKQRYRDAAYKQWVENFDADQTGAEFYDKLLGDLQSQVI